MYFSLCHYFSLRGLMALLYFLNPIMGRFLIFEPIFFLVVNSIFLYSLDQKIIHLTHFLTNYDQLGQRNKILDRSLSDWEYCHTSYLEACWCNRLGRSRDGAFVIFRIYTCHYVFHSHERRRQLLQRNIRWCTVP